MTLKKEGPGGPRYIYMYIQSRIDPNFQQDIPVHGPAIGGDFVLLFAENLEKMNQIQFGEHWVAKHHQLDYPVL